MQVKGHLVTQDGSLGGIVESVSAAQVGQPDAIVYDVATGETISQTPRPPLDVQQVHVKWEDGTESDLVEHAHPWVVLGSVAVYPRPDDDPVAAVEGNDSHKARVDAALADVAGYFAEVRAAAPFAEAAAEAARQTAVIDDPTFAITVVSTQRADSASSATLTPGQ